MNKIKIYLKSGQIAEVVTSAELKGINGIRNVLEYTAEIRSYDASEISLLTVEEMPNESNG